MKLQRSLLCLLFCTLIGSMVFSQNSEFTEQGKVSKLELKNNAIQDPSSANLTALSDKVRANFREILKKQVDATIARLNDQNDKLREFYNELWTQPTVDRLIDDLKRLSDVLTNNGFTGIPFTEFPSIQTALAGNLVAPGTYDLYKFSNSINSGKLNYTNAFNKFIITYYNSTYSTASNDIKTFNLSKWTKYTGFLTEQYKYTDSLIQVVYANKGEMTMNLFREIRRYHIWLNAHADYTYSRGMLKYDWFKQWIWMHAGTMRLNPLDFTTDAFLEKYPEYDVTKAKIYDRYIDSVINRYMLYDTVGKIDQFKRILNEKGTGKDQFKLQKRAEAMEKNTKAAKDQLTVTRVLNEVKIPKQETDDFGLSEKGRVETKIEEPGLMRKFFKKKAKENDIKIKRKYYFHNYTFSEKDAFETKTRKRFLTEPARVGEVKKLVVHNIPAELSAQVKIKSTVINDRSAFQEATDTILGLAAEIAKWTVQFSPFGNLAGSFIKSDNSNVSQIGGSALAAGAKIEDKLKAILKGTNNESKYQEYWGLFDEAVFSLVKPRHPNINQRYSSGAASDAIISTFLTDYETELVKQQTLAFEDLRKDSLNLSFILPAFANSSIPPGTLKEESNDKPIYYSKLLTTDASDSPVKYDLEVIGMKGTDSTHSIAKFSYKVGKNYRFQLGAGIAYTFGNFIQSSAKEENGQIVISNSAQSYRFITGLHIHFGKGLFLQDNRFLGRFSERSSVYIGVGIPKPLENVYAGFGYDLIPGLKLTAGVHVYRNDKYVIQNNAIIEKRVQYQVAGPFAAIQIDPASLLKVLNIIN